MSRAKGQTSAPVAFDFNTVEAEDVEMPKRLLPSKVDNTPFPNWYYESWESGTAKAIPLPTQAACDEAKKLAQTAGRRFGTQYGVKSGIRTTVRETDEGFVFTFLAVDRTKPGAEADAETEEAADEES